MAGPTMRHFESWVDRQIREARERGEFQDLLGAGKPLAAIDGEQDELWWVKQLMRREGLTITPPTVALRREVEELRERLAAVADEVKVRGIVEDLNARIGQVNRMPTEGPPSNVAKLDVERVVERWRTSRPPAPPQTGAVASERPAEVERSQRRRWLLRRRTA